MEISEIKEKLSLADVLKHYGLKPDRNQRLNCPFHEDKTPSMQVYWKDGVCYCFSSNCKTHGKKMDVIDFVMYIEGCSKHEAILKCQDMIAGVITPIYKQKLQNKSELMNYIFTVFKNAIVGSTPAKDYLQKRGLNYQLIEIGYNAAQFHHGKRKDETLINGCVEAGILIPYGYNSRNIVKAQAYSIFGKHCICFALRGAKDDIEGLYFRSTVNDEDKKHFYLKNRKGLYPCYPKNDTKKLILTEAIIDAATLLQIPEITENYSILSTFGTNGLGEEHVKAIEKLKDLEEIIFSFDGDESGRVATRKYTEILQGKLKPGVGFTTVKMPEGEDVNSFYLNYEGSGLVQLLEERTTIFDTTLEFKEIVIPGDQEEKEVIFSNENKSQSSGQSDHVPTLDTRTPNKLVYTSPHAVYSVLGHLPKEPGKMVVGLHAELKADDKRFRKKSRHDKANLYDDRAVSKIAVEIAEKLEISKTVVGEDLQVLTILLEEHREALIAQKEEVSGTPAQVQPLLSAREREEVVNFLKQKDLVKQLIKLLGDAGIVGEERNRIFLFLIAFSYKMKDTLHALIQGSSGSGKTRLLKKIIACMPDEDVINFTRISDKALYNFPEMYFVQKLFALEDADGLSEEAEFAFRELQSNGEIKSGTSVKLDNGQITGGQKRVQGPIASICCTTKGEIYEDNMSRVFLVAVDESEEQTGQIITYQNREAAGHVDTRKAEKVQKFIGNLVRVLEPLSVVNPYALKISLPEHVKKKRRLNGMFLSCINQIVLLHQYQRKRDSQNRLIATITDVEMAVNIMFETILLKADELDGSLRQFYENLKKYIGKKQGNKENIGFTLREIRQGMNISKSQLHRYMYDLQGLEYVRQEGGYANKGYTWYITYWDDYKALREKIKKHLEEQISIMKEAEKVPQQ